AAVQILYNQRVGSRQPTAPQWVIAAYYEEFLGRFPKSVFQLWPDKAQKGQSVHAPQARTFGGTDGDVGVADLTAARSQLTGDHPADRPIKPTLRIVDTKGVAPFARPSGFNAPVFGQFKFQCGDGGRTGGFVGMDCRNNIVAAKDGPVFGHHGVEPTRITFIGDLN